MLSVENVVIGFAFTVDSIFSLCSSYASSIKGIYLIFWASYIDVHPVLSNIWLKSHDCFSFHFAGLHLGFHTFGKNVLSKFAMV